MVVVKADEKDLAGAAAGADLDGNLPSAALRDADRRGGATFVFRLFDRRSDILAMRANQSGGAIDDDLRRIRSIAKTMAILVLTIRGGLQRIRILPPRRSQ